MIPWGISTVSHSLSYTIIILYFIINKKSKISGKNIYGPTWKEMEFNFWNKILDGGLAVIGQEQDERGDAFSASESFRFIKLNIQWGP